MRTHSVASMSEELVRFDRPFQVWAYAIGHRQLLLRSVKSDDHPKRVDVLFKEVEAMLIQPQIPYLLLELATDDEAKRFSGRLGIAGGKVYILTREPLLLVAAGLALWHEDEGEYYDSCHFDIVPPTGLAAPR